MNHRESFGEDVFKGNEKKQGMHTQETLEAQNMLEASEAWISRRLHNLKQETVNFFKEYGGDITSAAGMALMGSGIYLYKQWVGGEGESYFYLMVADGLISPSLIAAGSFGSGGPRIGK